MLILWHGLLWDESKVCYGTVTRTAFVLITNIYSVVSSWVFIHSMAASQVLIHVGPLA